jgi:hypothetical protein
MGTPYLIASDIIAIFKEIAIISIFFREPPPSISGDTIRTILPTIFKGKKTLAQRGFKFSSYYFA